MAVPHHTHSPGDLEMPRISRAGRTEDGGAAGCPRVPTPTHSFAASGSSQPRAFEHPHDDRFTLNVLTEPMVTDSQPFRSGRRSAHQPRLATGEVGARGLPPLPRTTPHTLRRTYISIALLANNFHVLWVMGQGHGQSRRCSDRALGAWS